MYSPINPETATGPAKRLPDALKEMVQIKTVDLDDVSISADAVVNLSGAADLRWAGVVFLRPYSALQLCADARHDLYVLRGSLLENMSEYAAQTFISRGDEMQLQAGANGVVLFMYRDSIATKSGSQTLRLADLEWSPGRTSGMTIARLSEVHHRLMLVSWSAGTRARLHPHPWGEEIFVLKGRLQDQDGHYPAGTWQRLLADSSHEPFAEENTLILLRNGHLRT